MQAKLSVKGARKLRETTMMLSMLRPKVHNTAETSPKPSSAPQHAERWASLGDLGALVARAQWLDEIDQRFRRHLPSALAPHVRVANINEQTLVVAVSSPAWKARMRMETPALLGAAEAAGLSARALTIKVVPPDVQTPERRGAPLSATARATLETAAQSVSDPELKAQLLRLAASGRTP